MSRVGQQITLHGNGAADLASWSHLIYLVVNGWDAGLGWCMQVAAHGTGASLPTVEEQIVSLKIVTPTVYVDDTHTLLTHTERARASEHDRSPP